jgi:diguanylate cyclase (GGDEF)-like protein/PAS domain S-box-containing protein
VDLQEELKRLRKENERLKSLLKIQESQMSSQNSVEDLIDIEKLSDIFEKFSKLTGYTTGFVDQKSRDVLISTGWSDICKIYHRGSESSEHICKESNAELTKNLKEGKLVSMKECQHGMVDGATPVIIDGEHLADIFSGQVLFAPPDIEKFKKSAEEFGYDRDGYLDALKKVKIVSKEKLREVLEFLAAISTLLVEMGKDKKEYLKLNVSLEQKVKERLRETNSLLSLFDESDNVLFKWSCDDVRRTLFVSKSVEKLLGYTKEAFENAELDYSDFIYQEDKELFVEEMQKARNDRKNFFSYTPYRVRTKSGKIKWILHNSVLVKDDEGAVSHLLGYLSDITELKEYEKRLELLSQTDQLTQIKNRLYLDEVLHQQYARFIRSKEDCSIILIDIDFFKRVNDEHGHIVGDKVLIEFANILRENIRESDVVGRWGGEEFLIILPHTSCYQAKAFAAKLREVISSYDFTKVAQVTASFGIASFCENKTITDILNEADEALYRSKENGRNQIN